MTQTQQPRRIRRRIYTNPKPVAPRKRRPIELLADVGRFERDVAAWLRRQSTVARAWRMAPRGAILGAMLREAATVDSHKAASAALDIIGCLSDALPLPRHLGAVRALLVRLDGNEDRALGPIVAELLTEAGSAESLDRRFAVGALAYALRTIDDADPASSLAMVAHLAELHGTATGDRMMPRRVAAVIRKHWPALTVDDRLAVVTAAARKIALETGAEDVFRSRLQAHARLVGLRLETVATLMPTWRAVDDDGKTVGVVVLDDCRAHVEEAA